MPTTTEATSAANTAQAGSQADVKKSSMTVSGAAALLAKRQLARMEAEKQTTTAKTAEQTSGNAAAETQTSAGVTSQSEGEAAPTGKQEGQQAETAQNTNAGDAKAGQTEETSDVLSNFSHLDADTLALVKAAWAKQQDSVQKRIDKEVARRAAAERERDALKQQFRSPIDAPQQQNGQTQGQQAPFYAPMPTESPLSNVNTIAELQKMQSTAKELKRASEQLLEDGPDATGNYMVGDQKLTKEQVQTIRRNATLQLEDQIPQRANFIAAREQNRKLALEHNPWLNDPTSPEYQTASNIAAQYPFVRHLPNSENILGIMVRGLKAFDAEMAAKKNGANGQQNGQQRQQLRQAPNDQTAFAGVGGGNSRETSDVLQKRQMATEREKLKKTGGVTARDAAKMLLASDKLRSTR